MLQNEPLMFDRIQIGGIRREIQEITAGLLNQRFNAPAFVKRGIIINDGTPVGQRWIFSMNLWPQAAVQLMALKPHKRLFFQRGLQALSLMQQAF